MLQISADALLGIEKDSIVENHDRSMEREIKNNLFAEPLLLEFGEALIPCVVEGLKTDLVNQSRKRLVQETGMLMPLLRLRDNVDLKPEEFVIKSYDRILYKVKVDKVDDTTYPVMIEQVAKVCREQYESILNKQLVKQLIDQLKEFYPGVADGLVPEKISYLKLLRHLQSVVRERGNIRDMIHILEELEEAL